MLLAGGRGKPGLQIVIIFSNGWTYRYISRNIFSDSLVPKTLI